MAFRSVTTLPLTRRELEVADLVRDGLTNREIAGRLFISERTVEGHVAQICSKLGLRSRLQIATWVVEQETREAPKPVQLETLAGAARSGRRPGRLNVWLGIALVAALAIGGLAAAARGNTSAGRATLTMTTLIAGLNQPSGVAADPDRHAIYIADSANDAIQVLHGDGSSARITGKEFGFPMNHPTGLAVDRAGRLFIADSGNNRILVFDRYYMSVLTGTGRPGFAGDDGTADAAQLDSPQGVAVDQLGNVYIADTGNNRVREIDAGTGHITTVAGGGETDPFTGNYLGLYPLTIRLHHPLSVAITNAGDLVVADTGAHAIYEIPRAAGRTFGAVRRLGGDGRHGYSGDGGPATSARISEPSGLAIDQQGDIIFADAGNNRVRMINPKGVISSVAGSGTLGFSGDSGAAASAQLTYPAAVSADSTGNLYIADTGNARVRLLRGSKNPISKKAPAGARPSFPAGSYMAQIQARGKLVAFVRNQFPFFAYPNPQTGRLEGFDIDMIQAAARAIFGRDDPSVLEFVTPPRDRIATVHAGLADVADATLIDAQDLRDVDLSDPYLRSVDLLLVTKGSPIHAFADLAGKTVCVPDSKLAPELQAEARQSQPLLARAFIAPLAQCLTAVHAGSADAIYDHTPGALAALAANPSLVLTNTLLGPRIYGFALPKGHPEFVQFLDGVVEQLYKDGHWTAEAKKWLHGYDDTFNVLLRS
ncbi:MAG TPA: transporter substrate-binding domain-containing protein [Candidatus Dormibacteraeota bacterium]|nr:transporter substrate-binding domain-containing protein [Candidatus Dormibacteraeota bacterium]